MAKDEERAAKQKAEEEAKQEAEEQRKRERRRWGGDRDARSDTPTLSAPEGEPSGAQDGVPTTPTCESDDSRDRSKGGSGPTAPLQYVDQFTAAARADSAEDGVDRGADIVYEAHCNRPVDYCFPFKPSFLMELDIFSLGNKRCI